MPTTFNVIPLGVQALIDTTEGNTNAENASALVGLSFGTLEDPLWEQVQSLSPSGSGFGGGSGTVYDMNNTASNDQFSIDGGAAQTFDGTSIYNATITYTDGTTATITAVVFQDTAGNTYLAPEFSANADQTALEAGAIRSLSLDSLFGSSYSGMTGNRQTSNFAVCFAQGTLIDTPDGPRPVETLGPGDLVTTLDNGAQPIRWINGRSVPAEGAMQPIRIATGALGAGLPQNPLTVSRQHRMLVQNPVAGRMFGSEQVLIAAHRLLPLDGVSPVAEGGTVTYWHFLCDAHELVWADGAPAETLYLGAEARNSLGPAALAEIAALFPQLFIFGDQRPTARPDPAGRRQKRLIERLSKNRRPAFQTA